MALRDLAQASRLSRIRPSSPKFGSWDAQASRNVSYDQDLRFGPSLPDKKVTWTELAQVIYAVQRRQKHAPLQEGKTDAVPRLADVTGWIRKVLAGSMFGSDYANLQFAAGDKVTRGQACALIAALTDQQDRL